MQKSLLIVFFVTIAHCSFAQQDSVSKHSDSSVVIKHSERPTAIPYWASLGFSNSTIDDGAVAIGASLSVQFTHHLVTSRIVYSIGEELYTKMPPEKFIEAGILYGYTYTKNLLCGSVSTGLAYISITKRRFLKQDTTGEIINYGERHNVVGLPWQFQLYSRFSETSPFGIGLTIGGNVNKIESPFFFLGCLTIGVY